MASCKQSDLHASTAKTFLPTRSGREILCFCFHTSLVQSSMLPMGNRPLDPHEKPPSYIRDVYKHYQKLPKSELDKAPDILDFGRSSDAYQNHAIVKKCEISKTVINAACRHVSPTGTYSLCDQNIQVYEAKDIPGKWVQNASWRPVVDIY